nr:OmpA family protein [Treponemataceae bacterium]
VYAPPHKYPFTPQEPLDTVSTRPYSGIIIDARGALPVHGEYVSSPAYPCFFPQIWDEEMNIVYERNIVTRSIAERGGIVDYNSSDDFSLYEQRVGVDPLYIKAYKIYGRHRTDPVIRRKDALKITASAENRKLLSDGKVVILLDKPQLVYDVTVPQKGPSYYATYNAIKQYVYENKVPDIDISDSVTGILFSVDLKFKPDSPELLPEERPRIQKIAELLQEIIKDDEFTILVEGHTADIGKPAGQMNLSIERTRTVMQELVSEGVPQSLFSYKGYGGTQPVAPNDTEEGRAQNRRVDITARPKATYILRE